ncbi:MAG: hypothetical protein HY909_14080 [Deltaproteobacteria bacterium]|nr:hypothetical protein [Deltaproteobacteria bacterium]
MQNTVRGALGLVLAMGALGAGCGGGGGTDAGTPTDTGMTMGDVPAGPRVRITSPASGAAFPVGAATELQVVAENFQLEAFPPVGMMAPGRGHYHVYLDDFDGNDYLFADYTPGSQIVIPPGTTAGMHRLRVSLRQHDHNAIVPDRTAALASGADAVLPIMVVANNMPAVTINAPPDNTNVRAGGMVMLQVAVMNFGLVPPGMPAMMGRGHFQTYLDNNSGSNQLSEPTNNTMITATIPADTTLGPHRVRVSLRMSDRSAVPGNPEAVIRINVTAP